MSTDSATALGLGNHQQVLCHALGLWNGLVLKVRQTAAQIRDHYPPGRRCGLAIESLRAAEQDLKNPI